MAHVPYLIIKQTELQDVNIDESNDRDALRAVEYQLAEKMKGLTASTVKASRRRAEVEGQMSLDLAKMV